MNRAMNPTPRGRSAITRGPAPTRNRATSRGTFRATRAMP
jgi:hypothetical protein